MSNFNGYDYQELADVLHRMAERKDTAGKLAVSLLAQNIVGQLRLDNLAVDAIAFIRSARTGQPYEPGDEGTPAWLAYAGVPLEDIPAPARAEVAMHRAETERREEYDDHKQSSMQEAEETARLRGEW